MANTFKAVAGGLLRGLGQGLVADAQAKRERALEQVKQENFLQRIDAQNKAALERLVAGKRLDAQTRRGLLSDTFTDDQGRVIGVTAGGETKPLGQARVEPRERVRRIGGDSELGRGLGLQPGERADVTFVGNRATKIEPLSEKGGGKTFEFQEKVKFLRAAGLSEDEITDVVAGRKLPNPVAVRQAARELALEEVQQGFGPVTPTREDIDRRAEEIARSVLGDRAAGSRTPPTTLPRQDDRPGTAQAAELPRATTDARQFLVPRSQRGEPGARQGDGRATAGDPPSPASGREISRPPLDLFPGNRQAEALGLPAGSVLIGRTREGHDVYETPDGRRFVVEATGGQ